MLPILSFNSCAEWRAKYLDYKQGKKRVKAVSRAISRIQQTPKSSKLNPREYYRSAGSPYLARKAPPTTPCQPSQTLVEDPESNQASDSSDQVRKPILIHKRGGGGQEGVRPSYGSFVPTPPSEFLPEQLELPDPAMDPNSPSNINRRLHNHTLPKRSRLRDVDGAAPGGATNTLDGQVDGASGAYTVGESSPPPHRTAVGSIFRRGSSMIRHASIANVSQPPAPVPLLRRMFSNANTAEDHEPDVNMVPLDHVRIRENEFFKWMDGQLEKVESFYKLKEDEAGERLQILRDQLHEMRNRRIAEIAEARRSHAAGGVNGSRSLLHDLSALPTRVPSISSRPASREGSREGSSGHLNGYFKPVEKALNTLKPNQRMGPNTQHLQYMPQSPNMISEERMRHTHGQDPARDYVRRPADKDSIPYRSAKRKLKLALKEYYRGLELLKSYALLNRTAFRKINKKYDKATNAHPPLRYMSEKVNKAYFVQSDVVDTYLHAVEDLYARYFERGNHKVAMGKLRSSTRGSGNFTLSAFRSGLLIGTGAVFGIQGLINAHTLETTHPDPTTQIHTSYLLQIYGGYLLALYLFAFFCLDCAIWTKNKINYVFIFEFDPRSTLDWRQLSEFPAFFTLLLGLFVWINFSELGVPEMYLYYPVILIGVTVAIIFAPAPILFRHSRSWFAYSHWRLLLAGLYPVEFRDFFLGDMYCSLTYLTANIELFFCLYAHHWNDPPQCNSGHSRLLGFFTALPGIWRALQCLRRYRDTGAIFPHLANFGKYMTTVGYYMFLSLYRIHESRTNLALFITSAILNSLYSTFWDLGMDWSLLQPSTKEATSISKATGKSYPLLRPTLGYKNPYYYYAAMILDIILRFNWIFYAIFTHDTQHSTIASFFISFAEVTRRGIWVIFRVENEHAANVARFKASRDVPLPYKIGQEEEDDVSTSIVRDDDTKDGKRKSTETEGDDGGDELSRPPTAHEPNLASGSSLHRVLTNTLSRRRTPASGKQAEEAGREGPKRRMTFSRMLADAHTQDFEKKKKGGDIPNEERHGAEGIDEMEENRNSSDDDGSEGEGALDSERDRVDREREVNRLTSEREIGSVRRIVRGQNQEQREGPGGAFE